MTTVKKTPAILRATPGRVLKDEFLNGFNLTQAELSERTGIPRSTVNEIIKGKRPINAETALALGIFFGTSAQFWLNLQTQFDIRRVKLEKGIPVALTHQAGGGGVACHADIRCLCSCDDRDAHCACCHLCSATVRPGG